MSSSRFLLVGLLVLPVLPTPAHAAVTWVGDFETGDLSQFTTLLNAEVDGQPRLGVTTEQVAQGQYAGRVELVNEAVWPNGLKRVEFQHLPAEGLVAEGKTLCFAMSYHLVHELPRSVNQTIVYWESSANFRQSIAVGVNREQVFFQTQEPAFEEHWRANKAATLGRWHRVAMCVEWSLTEGRVDVWYDGVQVVTGAVAQTMAEDANHFVQFGLLRGAMEFEDAPVMFVDDVVVGETIEDVRPAEFPAPPVDEGSDTGESTGSGSDSNANGETTPDEASAGAEATGPEASSDSSGSGCSIASKAAPGTLLGLLLLAFGAKRARGRRGTPDRE